MTVMATTGDGDGRLLLRACHTTIISSHLDCVVVDINTTLARPRRVRHSHRALRSIHRGRALGFGVFFEGQVRGFRTLLLAFAERAHRLESDMVACRQSRCKPGFWCEFT